MAFPDAQSAAHTSLSVQDSEATLWRWAALEPSRCGQANGHWWVRYNGNQRPIFHPGSPLFIENAILEESVR